MEDRGPRQVADELREFTVFERQAQAGQLRALVELALKYEVSEDMPFLSDLDEIPGVGRVQVGGEGCPLVSEMLAFEVAGLLGVSKAAATRRISEALNLHFRHRELWDAVQALELEAGRARRAAMACETLPPELAAEVSSKWLQHQGGLSWTRAFDVLDELVREADPVHAAEMEAAWLEGREVTVHRPRDGVTVLRAQMDVLDARYVDATVDEIADILATKPELQDLGKQQLRAKALGVLAVPAYALALQQEALQPTLLQRVAPPDAPPRESSEEEPSTEFLAAHDPHAMPGHKCGTITQPVSKLQPQIQLVVHVSADAVTGLAPVARIERAGSVTTTTLAQLLGDKQVIVRPVIDLPALPAEDQYRPSLTLHEAVRLVWEREAFPFSSRSSRTKHIDLDHTVAYRRAGPPGQTALGTLTPLTRQVHRAKTLGIWRCSHESLQTHATVWTSPLGYRYRVTPKGTYRLN